MKVIAMFVLIGGLSVAASAASAQTTLEDAMLYQDQLLEVGTVEDLLSRFRAELKKSETPENHYLLGRAYGLAASGLTEQADMADRMGNPKAAETALRAAAPLYVKAAEHFRKALAGNPSPRLAARAHHGLGACLAHAGKLEGAARELRLALKLAPGLFEIVFPLAQVLIQVGSIDEAADLLAAALKKQPAAVKERLLYARVLLSRAEFTRGVAELDQALEYEPKHLLVHRLRSQAYAALAEADRGRDPRRTTFLKRSIESARAVVQAVPRDIEIQMQLIDSLLGLEDLEGAIEAARSLLKVLEKEKAPKGLRDALAERIEKLETLLRTPEEKREYVSIVTTLATAIKVTADVEKAREEAKERGDTTRAAQLDRQLLAHDQICRQMLERLRNYRASEPPAPVLKCLMARRDADVRARAIQLLGLWQWKRGLVIYEIFLCHPKDRDPSRVVRGALVTALGRLGDPAAIPILIDALNDAEPIVVEPAIVFLRKQAGPRFGRLVGNPTPEEFPELAKKWAAWWRSTEASSAKIAAFPSIRKVLGAFPRSRRLARYLDEAYRFDADPEVVQAALDAFNAVSGQSLMPHVDDKSRRRNGEVMVAWRTADTSGK